MTCGTDCPLTTTFFPPETWVLQGKEERRVVKESIKIPRSSPRIRDAVRAMTETGQTITTRDRCNRGVYFSYFFFPRFTPSNPDARRRREWSHRRGGGRQRVRVATPSRGRFTQRFPIRVLLASKLQRRGRRRHTANLC